MNDILMKLCAGLGTNSTKYLLWYVNMCVSRSNAVKNIDCEFHHVFPTAIFGKNDVGVYLTFREHYLIHLFLALHLHKTLGAQHHITKKATLPLCRMSGNRKNQYMIVNLRPYSKTYSIARSLWVKSRGHTPETIEKIKQNTKRLTNYVTVTNTLIEKRIPEDKINDFLLKNPSFKRGIVRSNNRIAGWNSLSIKNIGISKPKGIDSAHYNTVTIYKDGDRRRVQKSELQVWIDKGYKQGMFLDSETNAKLSDIRSKNMIGKAKALEHINKINKNPEKIKKTADKHRGMKRSEATRQKISLRTKNRIPSNKGKIIYHDPITLDKLLISKSDIPPNGWVRGTGKKQKQKPRSLTPLA